ncbi:c-type cytochrome [Candidatus Methylocalor cossyra]|uniref:Green heme protein n=1 Tax=Candidatus Methylocalor cossyra TaxID=3108543 RepID=A0ABM9NG80_9GAMM
MLGRFAAWRRSAPIILPCLLAAPAVFGQNFARGQELFEDQCQACHDDFSRPDSRHLRSVEELRKRIEAWATHTNSGWTKSEVDDVLYFLNRNFYRFDRQAL